MMKHVRLLPTVIAMGIALLVLKGTGLVRDARAEGQSAAQQVAANETPEPKDFASADDENASAAEIDVLSSLAKRRAELDSRDKTQAMRENVLAATEKRVDGKIAALKALQAQISQLLGQRDAAQDAQVKALVKTYSAMKPKDAARIFDGLDDDVLVPVAQAMKSDALAPVLAAMNPSAAQKLTVKLASRLNLPDKAGPDATLPAVAPDPMATQTAAAPAPGTAQPTAPTQTKPQQPAPQAATPPAASPAPAPKNG